MASSGSTSKTVTTYDTLKFSWWINSQSVENNKSNIGWKLELIAANYGYISSTASKAWSVTVNGSSYSGTNTVGIANNATKTLASGTTDIEHNADGSKTFNFSFSQAFNINFNGSVGTISGSGSGTLNTIPRATQPVIYTSSIDMGKNITITLPRASTSFAHVVRYTFAGGSGYISGYATDEVNWVIPLDLASFIPSNTSSTLYIYCDTYSGETLIGTKSVNLTINVPSNIVPSISSVTIKEASDIVPSGFPYIQYKSALNITVTASGVYGSTVTSKSVVDGVSYSGTDIKTNIISSAGNISIITTVTDSRGRTATKTDTITALAYNSPIVNGSLIRCNSEGIEDEQGEYMKVFYDLSVLPLNQANTKAFKIQYKKSSDGAYTTVTINATSYNTSGEKIIEADSGSSYDVIISAADSFTETKKNLVLSTAFTIFNIRANGKGFAFGKVSEKDGIEVGQEIFDKFGFIVPNGLSVYYNSDGTAGKNPNTELEELLLTNKNTPDGNLYYIRTVFFNEKTAQSHRTQYAIPYNGASGIYYRYFFQGNWSDWYLPNADSGWKELTLNTGWYTYKSEYPYDIASYRKVGNIVYLRGLIGSTTEAGNIISILPAGFRPAGLYNRFIVCHGQYDTAAVQINNQGNIVDMSKANGVSVARTFLNLSGLSFIADN